MRDHDLVRLYWPVELRPAFDALFDLDDAMGDVVQRATQPALAAVKLAWWRERLEELDQGKAPAEPRLRAAARELLRRGIKGAELAELEAGWAALLQEKPDADAALTRGVKLFALAARLLGSPGPVDAPGRLYAAGSLARRGLPVDAPEVESVRIARALRPLTGLAALAKRDLRGSGPEGTPARAWTLIRHRLTGRL
ncbi:MAG: hypothetical protein V4513_10500 [Pseudomonadota bacterium]